MEPGDDESRRQAVLRQVDISGTKEPPHPDAGTAHLLACDDEIMVGIVRRVGPLGHEARTRGRPGDGYGAIVRTIVGQQLSTKAARSIYQRLSELCDGETPSPEAVLGFEEDQLRGCGLSRPKIRYLRDLAGRTLEGRMRWDEMSAMSDEEVIERLTSVKGLGRWSADMFLMFHLARPDVLPVGDLGIRRAMERAYALDDLPDPETMENLSIPWRPHRTLASLYLWESLDGDKVPATADPSERPSQSSQ